MLNIVIPMAGLGSRFAEQGYKDPKPLIPVYGKPMIQVVIENLTPKTSHRFTFIVRREHNEDYNLDAYLKQWAPDCLIIELDKVTEGAACTVLKAQDVINNSDALMIANCDQYVDCSIDDYLNSMKTADGLIMTFKDSDPKWSFIDYDAHGKICGVVEKVVVSDDATVGIYNFAKGADFVHYAQQMIDNNQRVNGEFYVAPVYTSMIQDGKAIKIHNINGMHGLGTPNDLNSFLAHDISKTI